MERGLQKPFFCPALVRRGLFLYPAVRSFLRWKSTRLSFEGDRLCSHNALLDPISGDLELTQEQLEANAAAVAEKNRAFQLAYSRNLTAKPTAKHRAQQRLKNKNSEPKMKAKQQAAKKIRLTIVLLVTFPVGMQLN